MARKTLTLQNIELIDRGKIAIALNQALKLIAQDVAERPGDKTARKVKLVISMAPRIDTGGALAETLVAFGLSTSIPTVKSAVYPMLNVADALVFSPDAPYDPRQGSLVFDHETGEITGVEDDVTPPPAANVE